MMKNMLTAAWKIILMAVAYIVVNAVVGMLLPMTNDLMAAMTPKDQAMFMPLFIVNVLINMTVMYLVLVNLRYKDWALFAGIWLSFWGLFTVVNLIEMYWYHESFEIITTTDVTKIIITQLAAYAAPALLGTWLIGGFSRPEQEQRTTFDYGRFGWKVILFCLIYPPFYFGCGFIPWAFPAVREFYAEWAATSEPMYVLLLFNIIRGGLWLLFSLPLLRGVANRQQAFWLMPLVLFTGTAVAVIVPSAMMPGFIRGPHFIELGFSMIVVGLFMAWLFVKDNKPIGVSHG